MRFEIINYQPHLTVVGRWAGGATSMYEPLRTIRWPGDLVPDEAPRVIRILAPLPMSGQYDGGKVVLLALQAARDWVRENTRSGHK